MFTVVNVPAIFKLPDKLIFAPVIVVPINIPALTFVAVTLVADNNPELTLVVAINVDADTFVAVTFAKLDKPDALIVPATSKLAEGLVVLIPKFPFVKYAVELICENEIDAAVFKTIYIIY
jgi:hypothetical protein